MLMAAVGCHPNLLTVDDAKGKRLEVGDGVMGVHDSQRVWGPFKCHVYYSKHDGYCHTWAEKHFQIILLYRDIIGMHSI